MKYKIIEVMPTSIFVEFENKSTALVSISPEATLEQIDHEVSKFDPEFLPKPEELTNSNIKVGEVRVSTQLQVEEPQETPITQIQLVNTDFGVAEVAEYFAEKGDSRLKDALHAKIEAYVTHQNFSIDRLLSRYQDIPDHYPGDPSGFDQEYYNENKDRFMIEAEDLMQQAEAELSQEQTNG